MVPAHSLESILGVGMERVCFSFELVPGQEDEYDRRHRAVWPELLDALRENGVRNYSIFRNGRTVIAYAECEPDAASAFGAVGDTEVNRRWADWFDGVIVGIADGDWQTSYKEVFHLE
ncbi:L-rhamnose mutarotase [Actinomadura sp. NBRC 104412]|nr:L-rhamnose mutarotase [Actinomadura sp. NBRC 104412]